MKKTALSAWHEAAGAKMIDFGGFLMPVQYTGIIAEHKAVREAAGLFDVSHMGNFYVRGERALDFLQYMTTNDLAKIVDGQAQYTLMLYPDGGIVDDLIIYRVSADTFFIIVNASNCEKDFDWLTSHVGEFEGVTLENHTSALSLIALQGPKSFDILARVFPGAGIDALRSFHFVKLSFEGEQIIVARTGYTGEAGVEICLSNEKAEALWKALMEAGKSDGIQPIGLGARDTLRLEMGYSLYGHEIEKDVNPLEARLKWVVKMSKPNFIGKQACEQVEISPRKSVVGFSLEGRAIPRQHFKVYNSDHQEIGEVCSGTVSPTLQEPIGTASLLLDYAQPGTPIFVEIRGTMQPGAVRRLPFVHADRP
ncbi:glycine cleavage system aminomethyltransferase GcvT [Chlorobaculum sp. MV4-Y]|uniref:glycine cleavage system aminomethyltransferase GcvT n=1 Tax=Chlorobaculum sp. MV4-Y TaxID=2976335 RepID=UPI0021AFC091|nr:glycine cleavage system aminomethyltransferase GcvT [Chlorobaculum sp. MV4-Y]UWX57197.1 glycine cleavage system aminomethyltransferase GcvT [Chlorobaculum sp. MV4-Y]